MARKIYKRMSDRAVVSAETALHPTGVLRSGFTVSEMLEDGERAPFGMMFMDSAIPAVRTLRDAAGQPVTLHDAATGGTLKLNSDLITAIEAEAAKLNMSVHEYVQHVLKYSWSAGHLAGSADPGSPAKTENQ